MSIKIYLYEKYDLIRLLEGMQQFQLYKDKKGAEIRSFFIYLTIFRRLV